MGNRKLYSKVFVFNYLLRFAFLVLLHPSNQIKLFVEGIAPNPTANVQLQQTCDELNLCNRMSEMEAKHRHQENEIGTLKTLRIEDQKVINQLRDRVDQLESVESTTTNEKILERQKRPFRLASGNYKR